ncbi:unnamed protein product [Phaeothamnion confervicola]
MCKTRGSSRERWRTACAICGAAAAGQSDLRPEALAEVAPLRRELAIYHYEDTASAPGNCIPGLRGTMGIAYLLEHAVYIAVVLRAYYTYCWQQRDAWTALCQGSRDCKRRLGRGWLNGWTLDNGDSQWRDFRGSLPLLCAAALGTSLLSWLLRWLIARNGRGRAQESNKVGPGDKADCPPGATWGRLLNWARRPAGPANLTLVQPRILLSLVIGACTATVLHGAHVFFAAALASFSFAVARMLRGTAAAPWATWALALGLIWFKERHHASASFGNVFGQSYAWLDGPGMRGMYPWRLSFNLVVLKLVSFAMDCHWATKHQAAAAAVTAGDRVSRNGLDDKAAGDGGSRESSGGDSARAASGSLPRSFPPLLAMDATDVEAAAYKHIVVTPRPTTDYSYSCFMAYVLYAPLYIAGPILPFNAFAAQMHQPQRSYPPARLALYALRWVAALALMEGLGHRTPVFAMAQSSAFKKLLATESFLDIAAFALTTLTAIWLKFMVMWRLMRLWALSDGVETVENMQRCMHNNYRVSHFWRGWHCSFNKWLIRYIYVPLGGARNRQWNVFVVFFFVAVWHDIEWKLVVWGMLNAAALVVEVAAVKIYRTWPLLAVLRARPAADRAVCALAAAFYVVVLMVVNLIGYGTGLKGTGDWLQALVHRTREQPGVLLSLTAIFFCGTQCMFVVESLKASPERAGSGRTAAAPASEVEGGGADPKAHGWPTARSRPARGGTAATEATEG